MIISSASSQCDPTLIGASRARAVVRCPKQLCLHRALVEIGWTGLMGEFNDAARLKVQSVPQSILITTTGTVLAGFGRWRLALFEGRQEIHCIEYALSEDDSLQFILAYHQSRRGWNAFVRIRLALTQEPSLQQRAFENMCVGGKYKGSANLPDLQRIDVREQIAIEAGVCARNVSNVKTILQLAHPRIIEALSDGALTINRAVQFCKSPRNAQLEQLICYCTERATAKVIRQSLSLPRKQRRNRADIVEVLDALRRQEVKQPGSIAIRLSARNQSVVLIGRDLLSKSISQEVLNLT